ncbi:hypothetical protein BV25DRAFT_1736090 [Artomyces pyxidatus]|uniref:Uncharacterized protein n=1 Tax=Artomyces pyxidatus TaxID=48021 RepID=A0ACB8SGZ5_9AGAM|nr:hypothetical protein BV25DRAFT_1736090 [Artomyces pyxidatus]
MELILRDRLTACVCIIRLVSSVRVDAYDQFAPWTTVARQCCRQRVLAVRAHSRMLCCPIVFTNIFLHHLFITSSVKRVFARRHGRCWYWHRCVVRQSP